VKVSLLFAGYRLFKPGRTLSFEGKTYPYLYRRYNLTCQNERAVEIPIFQEIVGKYPSDQVLEVGNVLAHYMPVHHTVVDKYEKAPGVLNQDVVDYQPGRTFDLIIAISTLEHVGWDEPTHDPEKLLPALANLRRLLSPQGKLMVSMPVGYNPTVDRLAQAPDALFAQVGYLKRMTRDNIWKEVAFKDVAAEKYNSRIPTATAVMVGVIEPESR
jgi:SAM-dependent methyltransferase